ncbi:glycosyltransferase family 4 protein [Pinirhizobacter sp.]|jgi:glycosyltransferase involved in cell wall biosynthesis|uniref:glycosyltransferase family 4 protein n=1 Tax=Pinirhizobacter sp. TaxID=2950432 RepID=UPI002F3F99F1
MKVLIVNNMAPFVWGGAEELAHHLARNLEISGHEADILRIPFQWNPATGIPAQMAMVRAFDVRAADRVIVLKFPAYLVDHPEKTYWLLHQYRQAYDLFDAGQTNISLDEEGRHIRSAIHRADDESFREARAIFTNSDVTRDRLQKYNGFKAQSLPPPLNDPELFTGGDVGNYVFAGGRVNLLKRQHLLIEAMRFSAHGVRLVVAGPPDSPEDAERLQDLVGRYGLEDRVSLDLRFLPRRTYADYLNGSAAVAYLPFDEDSLGYVSMEGATAGKALLTTDDSGGVLGLVASGQTGFVVKADPRELAHAMNSLQLDKELARRLGLGAKDLWRTMNITWPATIRSLLA